MGVPDMLTNTGDYRGGGCPGDSPATSLPKLVRKAHLGVAISETASKSREPCSWDLSSKAPGRPRKHQVDDATNPLVQLLVASLRRLGAAPINSPIA